MVSTNDRPYGMVLRMGLRERLHLGPSRYCVCAIRRGTIYSKRSGPSDGVVSMTWAQFVLIPAAICLLAFVRVGWSLWRGRGKS